MGTIIGSDDRSMGVAPDEAQRAAYTGRVDFRVVLVRGAANDVAAYRGAGPKEWVAANGDKLSQAEAMGHFPGLDTFLKREGLEWRE